MKPYKHQPNEQAERGEKKEWVKERKEIEIKERGGSQGRWWMNSICFRWCSHLRLKSPL
jgi:hypothetical protein